MQYDSLSVEEIRNLILAFKNEAKIQKLQNLYYSKSFSEILGISRREVPHSNFLAWILNDKESHGLSLFSFHKFLEILVRNCIQKKQNYHNELFNAVITNSLKITDVKTESEKFLSNAGRLDIYLEASIELNGRQKTLKIIIENKVESREQNDQTTAYYNFFQTNDPDQICLFVYLTAISTIELNNLEESECSCKAFIQINYQSLVDFLLEPALQQNISTKTSFIIQEYLQSLSQPAINYDTEEYNQGLIMALRTEERKLLQDFWESYNILIKAALYSVKINEDTPPEVRESIDQLLESESSSKDKSTYSLFFEGKNFISKIKKADIGLHLVRLLNKNNLITSESFDFVKNDTSASFLLMKKIDEITENEKKYSRYRFKAEEPDIIINDIRYYVARNWGKDNTNSFLKKFTAKFPGITFEKYT